MPRYWRVWGGARGARASAGARTGRPSSSTTLTRRRGRGSEPSDGMVASGPARADAALTERLVGLDDLLHQAMAHDIFVVEMDERDALDLGDDLERLDQAGRPRVRQIDLRHVTRDDRLRAEPEAGEGHLHLLGCGVLRLVEDDERVVQGAATHEGERRDFDSTSLQQPLHPVD